MNAEATRSAPNASPRLEWVKAHAVELTDLAASFGAVDMRLCGSVSRGDDHEESDIDFFVWEFTATDVTALPYVEPRDRADELVRSIRQLCPYNVDIRGLPGWPADPSFEMRMRADSVRLRDLAP